MREHPTVGGGGGVAPVRPRPAADAPVVQAEAPLLDEAACRGSDPGLFRDIPSWVWRIFLAAWASFFLLMFAFFARSIESTFVIVVSILFAMMAFGLPLSLASQAQLRPRGPCRVIDTHTGPLDSAAAGVQIALIPVAVVIGLLGFILFAKI